MSRRAGVRCAHCGQLVPASSVWAINGLCSHCLQPLDEPAAADSVGAVEPPPGPKEEATVRRWFEAFNSRDLEAMLACTDPEVDFHPLRLHGLGGGYRGHEGMRQWFEEIQRFEHHHRIELAELRAAGTGQLVALGTLSPADPTGLSSFWALERLTGNRIVTAYHFLTDPEVLRESGLRR